MRRPIRFFTKALPPFIGGMEQHSAAFVDHFTDHLQFPLSDAEPAILFFNSGHWIEDLPDLRRQFPRSLFVYRTGGNEILKAPLSRHPLADHSQRQRHWVKTLNQAVDHLITNSAYTERRLRTLGLTLPFTRCVGGVHPPLPRPPRSSTPRLFCAARFVPYKNHATLLRASQRLLCLGIDHELRLAGDGPLLKEMKGLSSHATFLGPLPNSEVREEIAAADLYVQLSCEGETTVPGGSYLHAEGMGRALLEAISCGTPVLAGQAGAVSEIMTHQRGQLVDPHDLDTITQTLASLITTPMAPLPQTDAYNWSHLFQTYEELFTG